MACPVLSRETRFTPSVFRRSSVLFRWSGLRTFSKAAHCPKAKIIKHFIEKAISSTNSSLLRYSNPQYPQFSSPLCKIRSINLEKGWGGGLELLAAGPSSLGQALSLTLCLAEAHQQLGAESASGANGPRITLPKVRGIHRYLAVIGLCVTGETAYARPPT